MERLEERALLSVAPRGPLPWPGSITEAAAASQLAAPDVGVASEPVITTIAGTGVAGLSGDGGAATKAKLNLPEDVAVDLQGSVFIADFYNNRIRQVTKNGKISSITGGGVFGLPSTVAIDPSVTDPSRTVLYVGEDHGDVHRLEHTPGGWVTTPYVDRGGSVTHVAVDKNGDLYFAENSNGLYKVDHTPPHNIEAIVGGPGTVGLNNICSVAVDSQMNLFFTSEGNIWRGNASQGYPIERVYTPTSGNWAHALAVSATEANTVYFCEGDQVWKLSGGGKTLVAGNGEDGYDGDGGPPQNAKLDDPGGVAVDAAGNIYIADRNNYRVRAIKTPPPIVPTKLVFAPMTVRIIAGLPFPSPVSVTAKDARGRIATDFNGDVTLTVADTPVPTLLGGQTTVKAVNGVATFSGLTLTNGTPKDPMWSTPYYHLVATAQLEPTGDSIRGTSKGFGVLGYTPAQIRKAYGFDETPLDPDGKPHYDGRGQTIVIVNAYGARYIYNDLNAFDKQFALTPSGKTLYELYGDASSFLTVVNSSGKENPLPKPDPGDGLEAAMDVQWVHAIAPGAKIVLIESPSAKLEDQMRSVATAVNPPAGSHPALQDVSVVSMSWGIREKKIKDIEKTEEKYDAIFTTPEGHQGVTFVAATGDDGAPGGYPAYSPNVVAVGGTRMYVRPDNTYGFEVGWRKSGGGRTARIVAPDYQDGVEDWGTRSIPDVSFLADASTPVAVYNSYKKKPAADHWERGGGTSLGAPVWAGIFAMVNQGRVERGTSTLNTAAPGDPSRPRPTEAHHALYSLLAADFHKDIDFLEDGVPVNGTSNSGLKDPTNYNLVTGLGTPRVNFLLPDLIAYVSPASQPKRDAAVAASGSMVNRPQEAFVAAIQFRCADSGFPSADATLAGRSIAASALDPGEQRVAGSRRAMPPVFETIRTATATTLSASRNLRRRAGGALLDVVLDGAKFGAMADGVGFVPTPLAAGRIMPGAYDAAIKAITRV